MAMTNGDIFSFEGLNGGAKALGAGESHYFDFGDQGPVVFTMDGGLGNFFLSFYKRRSTYNGTLFKMPYFFQICYYTNCFMSIFLRSHVQRRM